MAKIDELMKHLATERMNRIKAEFSVKEYFDKLSISLVEFLGCKPDFVSISYLSFDAPDFNVTISINIPLGEGFPLGDLGSVKHNFLLYGEYLDSSFIILNDKKFALDTNEENAFLQELFNSFMKLKV